jgi:predicted DNA-binding protein
MRGTIMATLATRISETTKHDFVEYAKCHNKTPSDFLRAIIEEYLDNELDRKLVAEYKTWKSENPDAKFYTFEEVVKEFGLENEM